MNVIFNHLFMLMITPFFVHVYKCKIKSNCLCTFKLDIFTGRTLNNQKNKSLNICFPSLYTLGWRGKDFVQELAILSYGAPGVLSLAMRGR